MNIFRQLVTADRPNWKRIENYVKEERALQPIRKIVINGSVDVIFIRSNFPTLVVAGESMKAVASVKTNFKGGKLVVEREGISIGMNVFHGSVGQFITVGRNGVTITGGFNGGFNQEKVVIGIGLPEAPAIKIKGSGDINLLDLIQNNLDLEIIGSGDITVQGKVHHLDVQISGSGEVDASTLMTEQANLSISGSGNIDAFVSNDVCAGVSGSGNIVVRGNPSRREHSVSGSGKIKFR